MRSYHLKMQKHPRCIQTMLLWYPWEALWVWRLYPVCHLVQATEGALLVMGLSSPQAASSEIRARDARWRRWMPRSHPQMSLNYYILKVNLNLMCPTAVTQIADIANGLRHWRRPVRSPYDPLSNHGFSWKWKGLPTGDNADKHIHPKTSIHIPSTFGALIDL